MSKYESGVKQIPHPQEAVYNALSDLSNIERVKDRIPAGQIQDLTFDHDTVSISVPPVGSITLKIIERDEPKCIKFETENSPVPFNMWIQLLPVSANECKMKLTIGLELNSFMKAMVQKPLQDGVERMATALAAIPY